MTSVTVGKIRSQEDTYTDRVFTHKRQRREVLRKGSPETVYSEIIPLGRTSEMNCITGVGVSVR